MSDSLIKNGFLENLNRIHNILQYLYIRTFWTTFN